MLSWVAALRCADDGEEAAAAAEAETGLDGEAVVGEEEEAEEMMLRKEKLKLGSVDGYGMAAILERMGV